MNLVEKILERARQPQQQERGVLVRSESPMQVTVAELRAVAASNPKHPIAGVFVRAVQGMPAEAHVFVDRTDLRAVGENRERLIVTQHDDVGPIHVKQLGEAYSDGQPVQRGEVHVPGPEGGGLGPEPDPPGGEEG